jgi:isoaspartyl peptidase/L-asparaginase-like protein (Ntn-hydrolase superfamily)
MITSGGNRKPAKPDLGTGTRAERRRINPACPTSCTADATVPLGAACQRALHEVESRVGTGGCIAVGPDGTVAMPFTSAGMFRGWIDATGDCRIGMFAEDLTELHGR